MGLFDIDPQLLQGIDMNKAAQNPGFMKKLMGLLGSGPDDPQSQGLLGLSSALLQASGPSTMPTSFGQAMGQGLQSYNQNRTSAQRYKDTSKMQKDELAKKGRLIDAQVSHLNQKTTPDGFTLGPGQSRFDAFGRPIASVGEDNSKKAAQSFDDASKMRNEFINQSKDFKQIRDSYERIYEAGQNPSAAGDLALIFNYMKMLDPGSTVREGEFANAQNAAGIPERVAAMYNNAMRGERLTDQTRADFLGRSDKIYEAQLRGQQQLEDTYRELSSRNSLDPRNVVIDYRVKGKRPEKPKGGVRKYNPQTGRIENAANH